MKKNVYCLISLFVFLSCNEKDDVIAGKIEIPEETSDSMTFNAEGGEMDFSFTTNLDWTATTTVDWIKINPSSGISGNNTITVVVDETSVNRASVITIECGNDIIEISVDQNRYPTSNSFEVSYTEMTLENYLNDKFEWQLLLRDEDNQNSYGYSGSSITVTFYLDSEWNYSKGIPFGDYAIDETTEAGTASAKITKGWNNTQINSGWVELIEDEAGLKVGFVGTTTDGEKINTYYTASASDLYVFNNAYGSSITQDLYIDNYPQAYIEDEGDVFGIGKRLWNLNIAQSDIQFKYIGVHEGIGDWLSVSLVTPMSATSPAGTYEFVFEDYYLKDWTALCGERSWLNGQGINSWWKSQVGPNDFIKEAPFVAGIVEITENADGTFLISITGVDDALPQNHTMVVQYNGYVARYDRNNTGEFGVANADFYGPYEFPSDNMNWFIGVGDNDFRDYGMEKGKAWVFDVMARPDQVFTKGLPEGTYVIGTSTAYEAGTCHMAKYRIYDSWTLREINIVSGQIEVKLLADGREVITIDVVDENGEAHKGEYCGIVPKYSVVSIPYQDKVFNGDDARVMVSYNGSNYAPNGETPAKHGWDIIMEDAELLDSNGKTGLGISLELRTSEETSFEAGLPVGTFPIYEPNTNGVDKGIYNGDLTYYQIFYEASSRKIAITGGHIVVSKNGDDYTIELALETGNSEVLYRVTGGYTGALIMNDYSTWSGNARTKFEDKQETTKHLFLK